MNAFEQTAESIRMTIQGLEETIMMLEATLVICNAERRIFEDKLADVELEAVDRLRDYTIKRINELRRELQKQQTLLAIWEDEIT